MKRYILHLSDVFFDEEFSDGEGIDLRDVESINCYCAPQSADVLRERLKDIPAQALHWIDTGDYHYLTLFFLEKLKEPFNLVLIDNHPDDQPSSFEEPGMLSCGGWVLEARKLEHMVNSPAAPVYLSIDLDYLSPDEFRTDWSQGSASFERMLEDIRQAVNGRRILGIDICGGITRSKGATDNDLLLNRRLREKISGLLAGR